ncbi:MAG: lipopolysaccharide heptosyltransferase II [Planctomycetota bacterium]
MIAATVPQVDEPQRILVVQPSWVGDCVMATPTLRALRQRFPNAHIAYLMRRHLKPIFTGMPWADRLLTHRKVRLPKLAARLAKGRFDAAVLLPNSFRIALLCKTAGIPRIIGYDRDGRGFLLTDKLLPHKQDGRFVPRPMIPTYLGIAHYLGARKSSAQMALFITDDDAADGAAVLQRAGLPPDGYVLLNPGANYGSAKCWPPAYFAEVADGLAEQGLAVGITGAPKETPIVRDILAQCTSRPADLIAAGMTLGALKHVTANAALMITGDTGPRHIAGALGTPMVTLFGPTDPRWTEINVAKERQLSIPVFCGPCQRKVCPLDHRCMTRLTPRMVMTAAGRLLDAEAVRA